MPVRVTRKHGQNTEIIDKIFLELGNKELLAQDWVGVGTENGTGFFPLGSICLEVEGCF